MNNEITLSDLAGFRQDFESGVENRPAMNAVTASGLNAAATSFVRKRNASPVYSLMLDQKSITWQKNSGRCWMYAGFNILRGALAGKLGVENFVFSGSYLMFYDKLEKANLFLEKIIEFRDCAADSRDVMNTIQKIRSDGGEWPMFVNLVRKYGVIPDYAQPETVSTDDSRNMPPVVQEYLRQCARDLRNAYAAGADEAALREMKDKMLADVYRMYSIAYGEPPKKFDLRVRTKDGKVIIDRGITPKEFYDKYIGADLLNYVTLTSGAEDGKELKKYIFPDTGYIIDGLPVAYVSVPSKTLKELTKKQLEAGEPVWFGCDVGEDCLRSAGILATDIYDYEDMLDISLDMDRGERFYSGQAHMSHAMVFKGMDIDDDGKIIAWRVENTWGPDVGSKGMFFMTDEWFDKYTYQVIIRRDLVPEEIVRVFDGEDAVMLKNWQAYV